MRHYGGRNNFSMTRRRFLESGFAAGIGGMTATSRVDFLMALVTEARQSGSERTVSRPSLSRQLAQWAAGLRYEDLPSAAVDRVKGLTLHGLASAMLGSQLPAGQQAIQLITDE